MAKPVTEAVANKIHGALTEVPGGPTIDFDTIMEIIKAIFSMFSICPMMTPKRARQRAQNVANRQGPLHRLDEWRFDRIILEKAPDDLFDPYKAAVLGAIDDTTEQNFADMMAESQTP